MNNIKQIVKSGLCIGCGLCGYDDSIGRMKYSMSLGQYIPDLNSKNKNNKFAYEICPAKGYNIIMSATQLFKESKYDLELGYCFNQYVAFSNDDVILQNASSGGIMSQIAVYLLENKIVDRVLTTLFIYLDSGPRTKSILAKSKQEILLSQGSKYCPVDLLDAIKEIKSNDYKIAVIGTPCQIAGIRSIQEKDKIFNDKIVFTIGNFCGGFKNYKAISSIAHRMKVDLKNVTFFRFRGGGQPGSMVIKENNERVVEVPYPNYVGLNGISKHLRCHLCVDATAELADIACGDAWLDKYLKDKNPWSLVITRNKNADNLINRMINEQTITANEITLEEIKVSQNQNLESKKVRQKSRYVLYKWLGYKIPFFDGGYYDNVVNLKTELKVYLLHFTTKWLERLRLYSFFKEHL